MLVPGSYIRSLSGGVGLFGYLIFVYYFCGINKGAMDAGAQVVCPSFNEPKAPRTFFEIGVIRAQDPYGAPSPKVCFRISSKLGHLNHNITKD